MIEIKAAVSEKDQSIANEKRKKTTLHKYGVENVLVLPEIKRISRDTKLSKYGSETFNNQEKTKETIYRNMVFLM